MAILAVVVLALFYYQKLNQVTIQEVDGSKITVNDVTDETIEEFQRYETIAVFGLDNRDLGDYDFGNTDVIMILNIDNDTKEISMVSVYRDTLVNIAEAGQPANYQKANAAFAYGGVSQAINMLNQNLDLDIDNYVCVDFQAVSEAIDILGGVDIEIESTYELDYLNEYILATNEILGTDSPLIDSLGVHTLDGTQAVAYTRIRYTTGGDYKRALRQRRVLTQMLEKAKDASLSQINELLDAVFPDISTDMSQRDLLSLGMNLLTYDIGASQGFPFDRADAILEDGPGDVVVPCDMVSNVTQLHELLFGVTDYQPSHQVREISRHITEMTGMTAESSYTDQFSYDDAYDYDSEEDLPLEDEDSSSVDAYWNGESWEPYQQ